MSQTTCNAFNERSCIFSCILQPANATPSELLEESVTKQLVNALAKMASLEELATVAIVTTTKQRH